ncbi:MULTISPECIES: UxaA family hydrolase [Thermoanaerobacterium]|uniref:D-galactarate dehydratase/Altronate hydrolase domain protein n=2 Tax=Thermoanaerobacterium TaxID=28895 RepID=W9EEF5_9THEO|nr:MULTISPECIES: altronate dehydratase family protein [Thermoanaerobacterium]AFK85198.1 D-galactarate dehydratase/Altronate hydrolase domain protein [Thermoanaerobacterium saccharolyticum JW/SL-YS485]ETO39626.1 D-galactarate dehydratase/Altronate hydrolase domain protein [Thermoanaerobacterium aotearoense SCUT27]
MKDFIKINPSDNVAVALKNLKKGDVISLGDKRLVIADDVPKGHKFALNEIKEGHDVVKYGYPIGHALSDIPEGAWVHTHNIKTNLGDILNYVYDKKEAVEATQHDYDITFKGYKRKTGAVGIRNELWVVPTVGCVNGIGEMIIERFKREVKIEGIDDIQIFKHSYGCSQLGDDHINTRKILSDIVRHPNAGGVLVLGLGCENNNIPSFKENLGQYDEERVKFLIAQEVDDEIEEGVKLLKELYQKMKDDVRIDVDISQLVVGLKCGGSDGFSGITANPLLGAFTDFLISRGGSAVLTEVPEMFGAEQILMERCQDEDVFSRTVDMINGYKQYFLEHHQPIYENPSPGNKAGGITTLEEKSLGCVQKGGKSIVVDVLNYGDTVKRRGLNLLYGPGNDLVSSTALAASGCHLILFTTGRGTPFGTFVPTVKISTNSELYRKKKNWIDFNAGTLIEDEGIDVALDRLVNYVLKVASGHKVNNEKNNFKEIAIFKSGVTL